MVLAAMEWDGWALAAEQGREPHPAEGRLHSAVAEAYTAFEEAILNSGTTTDRGVSLALRLRMDALRAAGVLVE